MNTEEKNNSRQDETTSLPYKKEVSYTLSGYLRAWLPALSLSLATFIFVSTEFMPIGLLPDMAAGLHKSLPDMGMIMTYYAWTVAVMSLPLTILSARWERRKLLLILLLVFIAGNALASVAVDFNMLLLARICIAFAHAIFWSIVTPLAYRVAPEGKKAQALGLVIAGASVAVVLGVPLGTAIGHAFVWRYAFAAVSIVAFFILLVMYLILPVLPSTNAGSLKSLPILARRPALLMAYLLTALVVSGHFVAYTYLTPYLLDIGHFSTQLVIVLLLIMGGAGIVGSIVLSNTISRYPVMMFYLPMVLVAASLLMLKPAVSSLFGAYIVCFIWGAAMTGVGLVLQSKVLKLAHDATDVATSIYSGIYNVGIGAGAFIGAKVYSEFGLGNVGFAGFFFVIAALVILIFLRISLRKKMTVLEN